MDQLDKKLLGKLAEKKGHPGDLLRIRKAVSAKAGSLHVSLPVALAFMAEEVGIGTKIYQRRWSDTQRADLRNLLTTTNSGHATPSLVSRRPPRAVKPDGRKKVEVIDYDSSDHFIKGHIAELNRAYTYECYTSVFILIRKIVENLIIDILKKKYPENSKENKELYFDTAQGRFKDFEVILQNLKHKRNDFGSQNKAVDKLYHEAKKLKDDANDKTHSLYHLVEKKQEIDALPLKAIIELIKALEKAVGIR